ncbi:hypothetical protein LTR95_017118 [Oleoguttula sp. CCFEE 5521]
MAHQAPQQQGYGYCNSYFVENHDDDDGLFARAAAQREQVRQSNKMKQKRIAEDLSRGTSDEYLEDILAHMEHMEGETMPDIHSIEIQTEIQWFMRPYLLDFLLEAHHAFQLLPETLHLAVNLLDRYCSRRVVYKRHYQLVGCASLLIAAKYGDRKERVPTIRELRSMCCGLYDDDMFTQMEWHVLQTLSWVVGHPTVTTFQQVALTGAACDPELEHLTWYLSEIALYHKEFIPVRPSIMARSALALARCILGRQQPPLDSWTSIYDPQVVLNLSNYIAQPSAALLRKYSSPHLSGVSNVTASFLQRQAALAQQAAQQAAQVAAAESRAMEMQQQAAVHAQNHYLAPQTPQKPGYMPVPVGVLTPPITPDKDSYYTNVPYGVAQPFPPRTGACTPTPPPSAEQLQQMNFARSYPQPPHLMQ